MVALSLFFLISVKSFAQEMLDGGNMENASYWATCSMNQDANNTTIYEFNYTIDKPTAGTGGCLHVSETNTGTTGGVLTNFMFYQQVTLQGGVPYTFDLAYKDIRDSCYWFEAYVGPNEPAVGSDYGTAQGAIFIGGWKSTNWATECPDGTFDGTFVETACINGGTNPFTLEGTGDRVVFVGFMLGIYDTESHGYKYEAFIDNVSLKGPSTAISVNTTHGKLAVYPNPASGKVTIANIESENIRLVNLAGQEVRKFNVTQRNMDIDVSGLVKGLYLLKSGDSTVKLMIE